MPQIFITSGRHATFTQLVDSLAGIFTDEPHLLICGKEDRCAVLFQNAWCALWLDYQAGDNKNV